MTRVDIFSAEVVHADWKVARVVIFKKIRYFKGLRVKMSTFVFLTETVDRLAVF